MPDQKPNSILATTDTFIAEVPIDEHRVILVYRRSHGGREFVRWRVFHRHRTRNCWYPDKRRAFVIPLAVGEALARAIAAGALGEPITPAPAWLA